MKKSSIKIKRLESKEELNSLREGDVVIISVGSGRINDFNEYHGPAAFIGRRLEGTNFPGWDFCRPQANLKDNQVGYHLLDKTTKITEVGVISSSEFFTYSTTYVSLTRKVGLI